VLRRKNFQCGFGSGSKSSTFIKATSASRLWLPRDLGNLNLPARCLDVTGTGTQTWHYDNWSIYKREDTFASVVGNLPVIDHFPLYSSSKQPRIMPPKVLPTEGVTIYFRLCSQSTYTHVYSCHFLLICQSCFPERVYQGDLSCSFPAKLGDNCLVCASHPCHSERWKELQAKQAYYLSLILLHYVSLPLADAFSL
jgi:hypothetical protein